MAIEQHNSKWSMLKLGDIYSVGLGTVAKNIEESERWYNEAASKGEPFGLYKIGNLYVKEKRDFENAIRWWKKAADRNCAEAHVQVRSEMHCDSLRLIAIDTARHVDAQGREDRWS